MKKIITFLLLIVGSVTFAQAPINSYQYIIVPSKFSFTRVKDEFRLNTLTKLLFEKYGFKASLDSEVLPDAVANSRCKALYADVESSGGLLSTKVRIIIKDCKNITLYASSEGETREKDWGKAYNIAIRQAFESLRDLNYRYTPAPPVTPSTPVVATQPLSGNQITIASENFEGSEETLFAQPITNGFQLVDSSPKVLMKIYKTSSSERFTAVRGDVHGELVSKSGSWFFEYYQNDKLVSEKVKVRF